MLKLLDFSRQSILSVSYNSPQKLSQKVSQLAQKIKSGLLLKRFLEDLHVENHIYLSKKLGKRRLVWEVKLKFGLKRKEDKAKNKKPRLIIRRWMEMEKQENVGEGEEWDGEREKDKREK